ncbi:hypothetical protein KFE25_010219 [Diacronema lutheri]|uniref:Uncharacterized protein n=2 Tax=Diacronema lutheri TaxID=2081491 RepID=A0A8J5XGN7_DIALT|nr:hypothetical protein KFE25_010219 [Diacronema lutheri]
MHICVLVVGLAAGTQLNELPAFVDCLATSCTSLTVQDQAELGTLPTEIGGLTALTSLVLERNSMGGAIPTELGTLRELTQLTLRGLSLTGSIPTQTGALAKLESLVLADNSLSGSLPTEWGGLTSLVRLNAGFNSLEGSLPTEALPKWRALETLALQWNQLSGPLPAEIAELSNLRSLSLAANFLNGPLPAELAQCSSLQNLWLELNLFSGTIPSALGELPLAHCDLTVPEELAGKSVATHPFNTFLKPIPPSVEAKCTVHWTIPFHMPLVVHKDCTMCLRHRCTLWGMNKCAAHKGLLDPQGHDKERCMCVCCAEQCQVDAHHIVGGCPGDTNKMQSGPSERVFYAPGMEPAPIAKGKGGGHHALDAELAPSAAPRSAQDPRLLLALGVAGGAAFAYRWRRTAR